MRDHISSIYHKVNKIIKQQKYRIRIFCPSRDLSPALPIQSQLCLPPNHKLSEIPGKNEKFQKITWLKIFEVNFKAIFDNEYTKQKYQQKENFWKLIVIQFTAN